MDSLQECRSYKRTCRFSVSNLDSGQGVWAYVWETKCKEEGCEVSDSLNVGTGYSLTLAPNQTKQHGAYLTLTPENEAYLIAKFTKIPTKQVCRDVTKTSRECRTVTRYRQECRQEQKSREVCE